MSNDSLKQKIILTLIDWSASQVQYFGRNLHSRNLVEPISKISVTRMLFQFFIFRGAKVSSWKPYKIMGKIHLKCFFKLLDWHYSAVTSTCGYWAPEMWPVWLRNWILNLILINLNLNSPLWLLTTTLNNTVLGYRTLFSTLVFFSSTLYYLYIEINRLKLFLSEKYI